MIDLVLVVLLCLYKLVFCLGTLIYRQTSDFFMPGLSLIRNLATFFRLKEKQRAKDERQRKKLEKEERKRARAEKRMRPETEEEREAKAQARKAKYEEFKRQKQEKADKRKQRNEELRIYRQKRKDEEKKQREAYEKRMQELKASFLDETSHLSATSQQVCVALHYSTLPESQSRVLNDGD